MWEEYAKARGMATTDMTQSQKVEAEYLGIMQETALQAGDLAKMSDTLAGSQAEAAQKAEVLARSFGEAMSPAVQAATAGLSGLLDVLGGIVSASPAAASGITAAAGAILALGGVATAVKLIKSLSEAFVTLGISMGPIAIIGAVIGLATGAYTAIARAAEEAAEAEKKRVEDNIQSAASARDSLASIDALAKRYGELTDGRKLTGKETAELRQIEETLAAQHGVTADAAETLAGKNAELAEAIRRVRQEQAEAARAAAAQVSNDARVAALDAYMDKTKDARQRIEELLEAEAGWQDIKKQDPAYTFMGASVDELLASTQAAIKKARAELAQESTDLLYPWLNAVVAEARTVAQTNGITVADVVADAIKSNLQASMQRMISDGAGTEEISAYITNALRKALEDMATAAAPVVQTIDDVAAAFRDLDDAGKADGANTHAKAAAAAAQEYAKLAEEAARTRDAVQALQDIQTGGAEALTSDSAYWADRRAAAEEYLGYTITGMEQVGAALDNASAMQAVYASAMDLASTAVATQRDTLQQLRAETAAAIEEQGGMAQASADLQNALIALDTALIGLSDATQQGGAAMTAAQKNALQYQQGMDRIAAAQTNLTGKINNLAAWRNARAAYDAAAKAGKNTAAAFGDMRKAASAMGIQLDDSADSIAGADKQFDALERNIQSAVEHIDGEITALTDAMANAQNGMVIHGNVTMDASQAQAQLSSLMATLAALKALMQQAGIKTGKGGGGGGGGGGKGNTGPSAYQQAIKDMEHLRNVGKLTEEQEVQTLNTIRQTVAMSAEDILDWEERLYQASEKVRQSRLQAAYDLMQYRQTMGQLDEAGAVNALQEIRNTHWATMTEEERRSWDTQYKTAVDAYYSKMYQEATALIQHRMAMGQLDEAAQLQQLEALRQAYYLSAEQQRELDEQIYALRESLRAKALQDAYADIDHKKAMNQLTLEEELAHLERIRAAYQLNAEERIALEERIHATTESLRQERESALSQVGTGLQNALKKRYESMRDAELEYITQSQQAWKDWAEESTKAIQVQIKALDELAQKEDREKTDQEELRKIAKLRQDIQYEQDDYNRANLQKQLEQAIAAREARLRKQDIQDQKAALQEQAQAIREKEQAEQEALKAQAQAIKDAYAQRMQAAAIQAEAERMLMQDSQQQIIDLIRSYAPEYDALGKTFGEKLLDGFLSQVGRIEDWMGQFNAAIITAQQQMASASLQAADQFYANRPTAQTVQVEQHNTFTVPVESPADTARRIRRANEELGMQLLRG